MTVGEFGEERDGRRPPLQFYPIAEMVWKMAVIMR